MTFRILFLALFCLMSVSCSSTGDKSSSESTSAQDQDAQETKSGKSSKVRQRLVKRAKSLELPPDLVNSSNDRIKSNAEAFDSRVLPEIVGARIQREDGKVWLEIDTSVESAWDVVSEYWITNGVNLVEYNPAAGTMETEWIKQESAQDEEGSTVTKLFKGLLDSVVRRNTTRDKYRIRFERTSPDKTTLFVSHRATARKAIERNKEVTEFEWVELPADPERVADFLQNIILIFDQSA